MSLDDGNSRCSCDQEGVGLNITNSPSESDDPCSFGDPACIREKSMHDPTNLPNPSQVMIMLGRSVC